MKLPVFVVAVATAASALALAETPPRAIFPPDLAPALAEVERSLVGSWLVEAGKGAKQRVLVVQEVVTQANGFSARADYGGIDAAAEPVSVGVKVAAGIATLDFRLPTGAVARAVSVGRGRFAGDVTDPAGKARPIALRLAGDVTPGAMTGKRPKEMTVVYVSAANCPYCSVYETGATSNGYKSKSGFLAAPEGKLVTFRQINTGNFMHTGDPKFWPDDLQWILGATYVASGTPRFVFVADGKVLANVRLGAFVSEVVPRIRQLAAAPP